MSNDPTDGPVPVPADDPPPVEQQRQQLAETVDALTDKLDVPARLSGAASDTAHLAQDKAKENQNLLIGGALALAAAIGAIIVIRRRRR